MNKDLVRNMGLFHSLSPDEISYLTQALRARPDSCRSTSAVRQSSPAESNQAPQRLHARGL